MAELTYEHQFSRVPPFPGANKNRPRKRCCSKTIFYFIFWPGKKMSSYLKNGLKRSVHSSETQPGNFSVVICVAASKGLGEKTCSGMDGYFSLLIFLQPKSCTVSSLRPPGLSWHIPPLALSALQSHSQHKLLGVAWLTKPPIARSSLSLSPHFLSSPSCH